MRLFIAILFFLITHIANGQTFKKDWTAFIAKNWTVTFTSDTTPYLSSTPVGQLIFKCKVDKELKVQYYVFNKSKVDSSFLRKKHEWEFVQSCGVFTDGKTNFNSFEFGQFYYFLKTCHNCNTGLSRQCQNLSNKLSDFVYKTN